MRAGIPLDYLDSIEEKEKIQAQEEIKDPGQENWALEKKDLQAEEKDLQAEKKDLQAEVKKIQEISAVESEEKSMG